MASRKAILKESIAEKLPKDLSDPAVQAEILSPPGRVIRIGGNDVRIYPLSGHGVRELIGFAQLVLASAVGDGPIEMRISGTLMQPRYLPVLISFIATSMFASPKDFDAEQHAKFMKEIDESTTSGSGVDELAEAFATLMEINDARVGEQSTKKEA